MSRLRLLSAATLLAATALAAQAQSLFITEIHAAGSSNGTYGADWFEVTNTGAAPVSLAGWKIDDNSESPIGAVALRGVTSLAPGQTAIFIEGLADGSTDTALRAAFTTAWFGANAPAGLLLGNYGGPGLGLDPISDAVNLFSGSTRRANLFFNDAVAGRTFDNAALLDGNLTALTTLSTIGVNGAFLSADGFEIGSPGFAPIPEPATQALLAGLAALGAVALRRKFSRLSSVSTVPPSLS